MELEFIINYSPRKKGEIVTFKTSDEKRVARFYLENNIAKETCNCDENKDDKCSDCEENAKKVVSKTKSKKKVSK